MYAFVLKCFNNLIVVGYFDMHPLTLVVSAHFPIAFYPDAERVIWMRRRNSELAY